MLQIFVEQISERLIYTLDFVFKSRGLNYTLTNDYHTFLDSSHTKLNYSERYFENITQLIPSSLLFDEELMVYGIHMDLFENEECLKFNETNDPLASIFYILSRMEEYTSTIEDEHGRFQAKNSVLSRFNWLERTVCDRWAEAFLSFLNRKELISYQKEDYTVNIRPTFDIDNAYAYQLKSGLRRLISTARDVLKRDRSRINERMQVLKGAAIDPYDTYDYILSIADRGFEVNIFWLLGDYAKFDKNISFKDARHQRLIRKMDRQTTVGIHPSYKSNSYEYYLLTEKERLEDILNHTVEHSRQHFLKVKIPVTYQAISSMGIKDDYTMGYAEKIGFRAGTARPFKWFDLSKNRTTDLTIHPFAYMDGTLNEYLKLDTTTAMVSIQKLYTEVKNYGGDFLFIWHNETIGNYGKWIGWKTVLEYTLNLNKTENE
jgi:hypothetical protein